MLPCSGVAVGVEELKPIQRATTLVEDRRKRRSALPLQIADESDDTGVDMHRHSIDWTFSVVRCGQTPALAIDQENISQVLRVRARNAVAEICDRLHFGSF